MGKFGKKRKHEKEKTLSSVVHKSLPVEVIAEDVSSHPLCFHGPTLLFCNIKGKYYSCSLCRNKKDCTVNISEEEWKKESVKKRNEKYLSLIPKVNKAMAWKNYNEVLSKNSANRAYCKTCEELYISTEKTSHNGHNIITPLSDEQLLQPSSWLPPLENDTVEAQYLFTKKCVGTILEILKRNDLKNTLCIGTPSVHEVISSIPGYSSILLDYDKRHAQFNPPNKYIYYNMFNNFLFNGREDEKILKKFFMDSSKSGICIVMDPPFGGRVEPLVQTLRSLSESYGSVNEHFGDQLLPVIWAFPYFSEPYITNMEPTIRMHDYQVDYENHAKFTGNKGRKHGSPVRLFTNLPLHTVDLSGDTKYRHCDKCDAWVSLSNTHCDECGTCTSKNGTTYKHCGLCRRCVKPTFFHCDSCRRCCLERGHVCGAVVESQSCYNCNEKGHKRVDCPQLKHSESAKKKKMYKTGR